MLDAFEKWGRSARFVGRWEDMRFALGVIYGR